MPRRFVEWRRGTGDCDAAACPWGDQATTRAVRIRPPAQDDAPPGPACGQWPSVGRGEWKSSASSPAAWHGSLTAGHPGPASAT